MSVSACMICFAENVKIFDVVDTHLQSVYKKLTNYEIQHYDHHLCFICHKRLQQCHQMFELALKLSSNPQEDGNEVQHKSTIGLSKINVDVDISEPHNMDTIKKEPNIEQKKDKVEQENVHNQVRAMISKSVAKAVDVRNYKEERNKTLQYLNKKIRIQKVPKVQHKSIIIELSKINVVDISEPYNMAIKKEPNIEQQRDIKVELDIKEGSDIKQENIDNQVHAMISKSVAKAVDVRNYKEEHNKTLQYLKEKIQIQKVPKEIPRSQPTLRRQTRLMLFNVYNYFLKENNKTNSLNKTAEATKKSVSTVRRIVKESECSESIAKFRTPGKKRQRINPVTGIDNFDKGVIRRCIQNFHITENELPTVGKLRAKLRSDINFEGSERSLRRIIKELGFKWKAIENNRKVLIETSAIRLFRINYLQKLRQYRQQTRPIVYTYESEIHPSHTTPKSWTDGSTKGLKKSLSKGQRVVIVHAGSETGFVPNALLIFKSGMKTGDFHDDMNFENYQKWFRTQLLPNLLPNSVIVVDNASYHNKKIDLAPNSNSTKSHMQAWLLEKGIAFTPDMLKPQLYQLIKNNKDHFETFIIDKIANEHGHDVLRLPPYHSDLNPIEMAWAAIKGYVSSKNVQWSVPQVIELVQEKVNVMGPNDWKNLCDKVKRIEETYVKSDRVIDEMTEEFVIRVGDSDGSDSELDSSTDMDD